MSAPAKVRKTAKAAEPAHEAPITTNCRVCGEPVNLVAGDADPIHVRCAFNEIKIERDTAKPPVDSAPNNPIEPVESTPVPAIVRGAWVSADMPIAWIWPSVFNPRSDFDPDELAELAESIKEHGLLEPIVVREVPLPENSPVQIVDALGLPAPRYEIVAGERRWRACTLAKLEFVPTRVLADVDDQKAITLAIVENLHRADLNPMEEARGYAMLRDQGLTQGAIGALVKKSQPVIAKALGMLKLPDDVQELIKQGKLSPAHAAALERFKDFPAYVSGVAAIAARHGTTSKELQEEKLPHVGSLTRGPVRELSQYNRPFDIGICTKCPFNAYRKGQYDQGYCFRPEHFDELKAAAEALKVAEQKTAIAAAVADAGVDVAALPVVQDISGQNTVPFYSWATPAPGCSAECPCSIQALDRDRGELIRVCTNRARHTELNEAASKAAKAARLEKGQVLIAGTHRRLDSLPKADVTIHELVLLVGPLVRGVTDKAAWKAALERNLPGVRLGMQAKCTPEDLLALDGPSLVRFAVDVVITAEQYGAAAYEWGTPRTPSSDWYGQFCGVKEEAVEA